MSDLLPLTIFAARGNWQKYSSRRRNQKFQSLEQHIFDRDHNTCRYCGFFCEKFGSVVNIDQDYNNNKPENLATACSLCSQCFFLDSIGGTKRGGGYIIHLPEISQADVNHFSRALFCSMSSDVPYKGKLHAAYLNFKDRSTQVEEVFGPETKEPNIFGQALIDAISSEENDESIDYSILKDLRLLPIKKYFGQEIQFWKQTTFANIPL